MKTALNITLGQRHHRLTRYVCGWLAVVATLIPFVLQAYLVGPPDGLDKMSTNADLICKARVMDYQVITNDAFQSLPGFETRATRLEIISVLKGTVPPSVVRGLLVKPANIVFQHYASSPQVGQLMMYSPQHYELEPGQSYLMFALKTGSADTFRQIRMSHTGKMDEGVLRTLDDRPLPNVPVKDAHWQELVWLLQNANPTNQLYAIHQLDSMSKGCGGFAEFDHANDFQRDVVLKTFSSLMTSSNDDVVIAVLKCYQAGPDCSSSMASYAGTLVAIASTHASVSRRVTAIAAFSGTQFPVVSNALPQWLRDPSEEVRLQAVLLLPNFPGEFSENALRKLADDPSPKIRAGVADAIGNGKLISLLPTLKTLLLDPIGRTNSVPPLTTAELLAGGRVWGSNNSDVHTAAGYTLLKFDVSQVGDILKANLTDEGFRPNYLCKLAEGGAAPWLTNLVEVLEQRRIRVEQEVDASGIPPQDRANYLKARMALIGTYYNCWNIIEQYLETRPVADFENGTMDRCLDALENAGTTGSREPTALYELYRAKGLTKRAAKFRREHGNSEAGYDIELFYNRVDAKYPKLDASTDH